MRQVALALNPPRLRPYQTSAIDKLRTKLAAGKKRLCCVAPTGSGKTVIASEMIRSCVARNYKVVFLAHRTELLDQTLDKLGSFGVAAGLIKADDARRDDWQPVQVCSVQTLVRRLDRRPHADLVIVDECFPAGTLIGERPIEEIRTGDMVPSFDECAGVFVSGRVVRRFVNRPSALVVVHTMSGGRIACTPGHPFWTARGWVPAIQLGADDAVLRYELPRVQSANSDQRKAGIGLEEKRARLLLNGVLQGRHGEDVVGAHGRDESKIRLGENAGAQSIEAAGGAGEDQCDAASDWARSFNPVWQRARSHRSAGAPPGGTRPGMDTRACGVDGRSGAGELLQGGYWSERHDDRGRGRRRFARLLEGAGGRSAQRGVSSWDGVVGVEIPEQGSDGTFGGMCPDGLIYNLEVEGTHTYVAAGVVVHNCHHASSDTYRAIFGAYADAVTIGLTATPWRNDKRGLRDVFEDSVLVATPAELMQLGYLIGYDAYAYDAPDLHNVKITAGEYNQRDLGLACNTQVLVGNVVGEYIRHAAPRRAIVFPVNIEHSQHLVAEFRAAGFSAEHVDCHTPKLLRARAMERFRHGDLTILSSVGVLTEGFDAPSAEVCVLARPTKSLGLHLQMIGRVLRPCADTGKALALIHDHSGNLIRHGFPDDERDWSLTSTPKRVRELHSCPICCTVFGAIKRDGTCPKCGELIAPPSEECRTCGKPTSEYAAADERCTCDPFASVASDREKIVVAGVRINRETILSIRERRDHLKLRNDLTDEQLVRAHNATMQEKAAEYLRLQAVAERKGFKKGFIGHQFRNTFGFWPQFKDGAFDGIEPATKPFLPILKKQENAA